MTRMIFLENSLAQLIQLQINLHNNSSPNDIILGLPVSSDAPKEAEVIEIDENENIENVENVTMKTEPVENDID